MMGREMISDSVLVEQTLAGDKHGFDELVVRYQSRLIQLISSSISDKSMAKDLSQDAFIKAYRSLNTFRGDCSFYTWLYRIAVNTVKNYHKYTLRRPMVAEVNYEQPLTIPGRYKVKDYASPEHWLRCEEMQILIELALMELPPELQESIILREIEGLSYDEIAEVMHVPLGTVRSRIFRARAVVEGYLSEAYNG